jgi:hypothetical protein
MSAPFAAGAGYYPGFQKFKITADPTFRRCLLAFVPLMAMLIPGVSIIPPGMRREILFICIFLAYMFPAAIVIGGGLPVSGWLWYSAAAALFAAATVPIPLGFSYNFLFLLIPSLFCLTKVNSSNPQVFKTLGYTTSAKPAMEIVFTTLAAAVLISYVWIGQAFIRKMGVVVLPLDKYIWFAATSALYYGVLWGILYGVLMRRFMEFRYNIVLPIALNIFIMFAYWIPSILSYNMKLEIAIGGSIMQSFSCQVALGMTYFYCRTTRPLLAAFVIHYLFLKTVSF